MTKERGPVDSRTSAETGDSDPPKPLKMLGFRPKVMGNDPPKQLHVEMFGFQPKVMVFSDSSTTLHCGQ